MANLVITDQCNLACPYCFAQSYLQQEKAEGNPTGAFISREAFEARLDFLVRSGVGEVRLIGGEPTLHPQFEALIAAAQQRGLKVIVFSHGVMKDSALRCLEQLPLDQCTVLINANASHPAADSERLMVRRQTALLRLGERALPGCNLYTSNIKLDWLIPLIMETGCRKAVRLGLAQPIVGADNLYLHPKQYRIIAEKIVRFAERAAEYGIRAEFDCGFVRCMFSDKELATLRRLDADIGWRCSPVLDIAMNDTAIHCFPLTNFATVAFDATTDDAAGLRTALAQQVAPYRQAGIYKECSSCAYKAAGECSGGCLGVTVRRFREGAIRVRVPAPFTAYVEHEGIETRE